MPDDVIADPAAPAETAGQPNPDPAAAADVQDEPVIDPSPTLDAAAKNRDGYERRQLERQLEALRRENEGYKRRSEEERKAKLTEEQRIKEERDSLAQENERLKTQALQARIAAEFKLPAALGARLIGSDEDALRADAEELAKLLPRPKVGAPTDPAKEGGQQRIYKRSELAADPALARSPEVAKAAAEGRVVAG